MKPLKKLITKISLYNQLKKHISILQDYRQMGKYIGYTLLVIVVVFVLEWFQIVDVPYFDIPDLTSGKKDMVHSTEDILEKSSD